MVTSFFPGRVRLRAPIFRDSELVEKARGILGRCAAVRNVEHNPLTGSVLVEYDPLKVPVDRLLPMRGFFERLAAEARRFDGSEGSRGRISRMLGELEGIF